MTMLLALAGTAGLGAVVLVTVVMARLTQRWELVTRSRSFYQLFYVSATLLAVASFFRLVRAVHLVADTGSPLLSDPRSWLYLSLYHTPMAIGMTIGMAVTWRNWGWLLREHAG
jgi:hypothetical protein